jgi:hypothetical protein
VNSGQPPDSLPADNREGLRQQILASSPFPPVFRSLSGRIRLVGLSCVIQWRVHSVLNKTAASRFLMARRRPFRNTDDETLSARIAGVGKSLLEDFIYSRQDNHHQPRPKRYPTRIGPRASEPVSGRMRELSSTGDGTVQDPLRWIGKFTVPRTFVAASGVSAFRPQPPFPTDHADITVATIRFHICRTKVVSSTRGSPRRAAYDCGNPNQ